MFRTSMNTMYADPTEGAACQDGLFPLPSESLAHTYAL